MNLRPSLVVAALCCGAALSTTGCVPLLVGGAVVATGTAVSTATDRRSTGSVVNDEVIEKRVSWEISKAIGNEAETHITVTSYNRTVLLTGEVSTDAARTLAQQAASASLEVEGVHNELVVMSPVDFRQRMSDSTTATKVRSSILATKNVPLNQMKIVVDRGVAYVMGLLTAEENRIACEVASKVSGVVKVTSVAKIVTQDEIDRRMHNDAKDSRPAAGQEAPEGDISLDEPAEGKLRGKYL
ncbi:MAG: BON domain-containing protein [Duodenibacillus sp.]|nr:BON domain-containing protein [Duodenibacillus sp.]